MPHHTSLISAIVVGISMAFIFGAIAHRLRVPPLVGYLLAGVLVGPFTPGFTADQTLVPQLAEIGIILLMFGVGLHFSLKDLLSVGAIAVPGAVLQIAAATVLGLGLGWLMDWTVAAGLVFGLALSVASTVVLLRALQERRLVETRRGRIAVGWLIVEDLAMVLTLVLLPPLAGLLPGGEAALANADSEHSTALPAWIGFGLDLGVGGMVAVTLAKVTLFIAAMLVVGRKLIPWLLQAVTRSGSRELFRLAVLTVALGVAFAAAELFRVSLALGAFFAGMVLSESELSHDAAQESLPLRDAFAVLFFVSVGMLFDPGLLLREPLALLGVLFIILIGKSAAAFAIVCLFGHPPRTALTIAASLAQIGEFSFILAELGVRLGVLPEAARALVLAGAILSILLNPLVFWGGGRLADRLARPGDGEEEEPSGPAMSADTTLAEVTASTPEAGGDLVPTALRGHVILVGYGRVGSLVGSALANQGEPFLVIEDADLVVSRLRVQGTEVLVGNAARAEVLEAANVEAARALVLAIPNAFEAGEVVRRARALNPGLRIIARAHHDAQVEHLTTQGADQVIMGEREIAREIATRLLGGAPPVLAPPPGGVP